MTSPSHQRVHARIHGRVQGVWYRANTREQATALGLVGWVRNLANGDVELVAEGPRAGLEQLIVWCERGPEQAEVSGVDRQFEAASGEFEEFRIT